MTTVNQCRSPENVPREYCRKLRAGLGRLRDRLRSDLETSFPNEKEQIALALKEAEEAAWITPFPALFFPPLAQLKAEQRIAQA
jgi:hypothetical protein